MQVVRCTVLRPLLSRPSMYLLHLLQLVEGIDQGWAAASGCGYLQLSSDMLELAFQVIPGRASGWYPQAASLEPAAAQTGRGTVAASAASTAASFRSASSRFSLAGTFPAQPAGRNLQGFCRSDAPAAAEDPTGHPAAGQPGGPGAHPHDGGRFATPELQSGPPGVKPECEWTPEGAPAAAPASMPRQAPESCHVRVAVRCGILWKYQNMLTTQERLQSNI